MLVMLQNHFTAGLFPLLAGQERELGTSRCLQGGEGKPAGPGQRGNEAGFAPHSSGVSYLLTRSDFCLLGP